MDWIELMGPSGVGKSYFYNKLALDACGRVVGYHYPLSGEKGLSRYSTRLKRYLGIATDISSSSNSSASHLLNSVALWCDVAFRGAEAYIEDPVKRVAYIAFYHREIERFKYTASQADAYKAIVFEDGVMHNNIGYDYDILYICGYKISCITKLLHPIFVINLCASDSYIFNNRRNRIASGRGTLLEVGLSDEQLYDLVRDGVQRYSRKVDLLRSIGVTVYDIDVEQNDAVVVDEMGSILASMS